MLDKQQVQAIKSKDKPFKVTDGMGLYMLVMPNGAKYWHFRYRLNQKQQTLALGVFPQVTLDAARIRRDEARKALAEGNDPMALKRAAATKLRAQAAERVAFRLSLSDGALTIQSKGNVFGLTVEQTEAVRAFLIATPTEGA